MNPTDLLAAINAQTRSMIASHFSQAWFDERADYCQTGKSLVALQWERLLPKLPAWIRAKCEDAGVFVGEWTCPSSFSATVRQSSDGWLIALPSGLLMTIYQMARIIASWLPLPEPAGPPCSEEQCRSEIRTTLRWISEPELGFIMPITRELTPARIRAAEVLATHAEWFVICHELAHILFNHSELQEADIDKGKWLIYSLAGVAMFYGKGPDDQSLTSLPHAIEFGADLRGFECLMASTGIPDDIALDAPGRQALEDQVIGAYWAGTTLYLSVSGIVTELTRDQRRDTHPHWLFRHNQLQAELMKLMPEKQDLWFGNLHGAICHVLEPIVKWAQDAPAKRQNGSVEAVRQFESALEIAARNHVPQFGEFLWATLARLQSEHGPSVCLRMRELWKRLSPKFLGNPDFLKILYEDQMLSLSHPDALAQLEATDWRIELRMYKLLLSLSTRLPLHMSAFLGMPGP